MDVKKATTIAIKIMHNIIDVIKDEEVDVSDFYTISECVILTLCRSMSALTGIDAKDLLKVISEELEELLMMNENRKHDILDAFKDALKSK